MPSYIQFWSTNRYITEMNSNRTKLNEILPFRRGENHLEKNLGAG